MGEALITRRCGGGGGLDGIAGGSVKVTSGRMMSSTAVNGSMLGGIVGYRIESEKVGYLCWGSAASSWDSFDLYVALIDWENQTVEQIVKGTGNSYSYLSNYGCDFDGKQVFLTLQQWEWEDGDPYIIVVYIAEV